MKKRIFLFGTLFVLLCMSVALIGCNKKETPVAPAENGVMTQYHSDWEGPHDVSVQIDGVLDEACWQNKNWYTTCAPGDSVGGTTWMKTTAFTTQFGVYMGVTVYDPNIVADSEFNIEASTCLEFFYTFRVDGKLYNTAYYQRGKFWLDAYGNYCTEGSRLKRAVSVDGVLGSGNTKSATFEIFIPWEQTGVKVTDDYPKEVYILPSCKIVFPGATQSTYTLGKVTGRDYFSYQAMYYE
ncbi:MAG: hypothetical protein K2L51_06310, partial [Clostridiales bacterium]|nr:hypothetical protein [Clostridiales bacterium]